MTKTFTIDETLISSPSKRATVRYLKMGAYMLSVVALAIICEPKTTLFYNSVLGIGFIVMTGFIMMIGYKRARKIYSDFQLTLDNSGVELKAALIAYQRIDWQNMVFAEKKNGDIKIYDSTVNSIMRWWRGYGVIMVPREINNRDQLLVSLNNYRSQSFAG